jgi:hypothetical protein
MPAGTYSSYVVVRNPGGLDSAPVDLKVSSATATSTPDGNADGPLEIDDHRAWPDPVASSHLDQARVSVHVKGRADRLRLKVYTRALICVGSTELLNTPSGWNQIPLPGAVVLSAGPGTYFYVVSGERGSTKTVKNATGRLVVLR